MVFYVNKTHHGVKRFIIGAETHVPHGMPSIQMLKFRDEYPNGCVYEGCISEAGLIKWGWVLSEGGL